MGAWDVGPFDNDDAADWLIELIDGGGDGLGLVRTALAGEAGEAEAVAAAALVARACGLSTPIPEELQSWWDAGDPTRLRPLVGEAHMVLDEVLRESELADLWDEAGEAGWRNQTSAMRDLLKAAASA